MIVAGICARGGSKGVPRKNLQLLRGEPLIVHTVRCALAAALVDRVIVSTDDQEIADVARAAGAEVPFLRPAHLARDETPKWPVFRHLIESVEQVASAAVRVLADLDTGVPLRTPADVDGTIRQLLQGDAEVAITAYEAERNPYFNMVERSNAGWQVCKPLGRPVTRRQDAPEVYSLSPAIFAMKRDAIMTHDHWSECAVTIYPMDRDRAIDIDTPLDFKLIECLTGRD